MFNSPQNGADYRHETSKTDDVRRGETGVLYGCRADLREKEEQGAV